MITLFLYGIVVGLAISIPMGSVGVSVIHRVITKNEIRAFIIGLGSATADVIFGIIAVYGLNNLSTLIENHKVSLGTIGGLCLFYISIRIFLSRPKDITEPGNIISISKDFATGFILTITNPLTAIAILALFAWFGVRDGEISLMGASMLISGLFFGLITWWVTLISITKHINNKFKITSFKIVNQVFGVILFILAILIMVRVL